MSMAAYHFKAIAMLIITMNELFMNAMAIHEFVFKFVYYSTEMK